MIDQEFDNLMIECMRSTRAVAELLFPHRFSSRFSSLHQRIFDAIDGRYRKTVICAPRGLGKTSIVALALLAKAILFNEAKYIVYICNNEKNAIRQMENLKRALIRNKIIQKKWPNIKEKLIRSNDSDFSKTGWIAFGRTMVLPRGRGQEVRGLLFDDNRPDLIVVDDLESRMKDVKNPEIRKEIKEWFLGDVMKCTSRTDKNWRVVYIDTMKHNDSTFCMLLRLSSWKKLVLPIAQVEGGKFKSNAPDFMSDEEIEAEYIEAKEAGHLDVFYRELMCIPMDPEAASFRKEYFRYYSEQDLWARKKGEDGLIEHDIRRLTSFVIIDPAKTVRETNCETAIVGLSIDLLANKIYIRDVEHGHWPPDVMYDKMINMAKRLQTRYLGVKTNSLNLFITNPILQELKTRGETMEIIDLPERGKKDERIEAMISFYRQGRIYHNDNGCCIMLEGQLLSGRQSVYKDIADAESEFIQILDKGDRYFNQEFEGPVDDASYELEYADLEEETYYAGYQGVCP